MRFHIDPMKEEPVFGQLVGQIKRAIAMGQLRPGEKLPTVRECATDLLINPNTVQKAFQELIREGLIYSRKGMGNFVAPFGDERQKELRQPEIRKLLHLLWTEARLTGQSPSEIKQMIIDEIDQFEEGAHDA